MVNTEIRLIICFAAKEKLYAAAASKLLQLCLTLCDPIDCSPPGSPVPGILQARTLEWVAISFSNAWKCKGNVKSLSCVQLLATPWTAADQAPPSIQSAKTRPGTDCGSDHELLIAKFRLKLKKVGKTTRPFRYDLNQIPYDCIVEVKARFKELDLIECLKKYGWRFITLYRKQWSRSSPRKRNVKRLNGCLRGLYK